MDLTAKKIALLKGGPGNERQVSLKTAESVAAALSSLGAIVLEYDIKDESFQIDPDCIIAMNLIHGTFGEDGRLQTHLQKLGVPYTGAGIHSSKIAFDKKLSKAAFLEQHVPTPLSQIYDLSSPLLPAIPFPFICKPPCEGSSVGVFRVFNQTDWENAKQQSKTYGATTLIEEYIDGEELTVGILGDQVLPVIRILPENGFYDINNKYPWMTGSGKTTYECPAQLSPEITTAVQNAALAAFRSCHVEVYGRVDVMLSKDGKPYVLEINTIPGMTSSSLLPKAAAAVGIDFPSLCHRIITLSLNQPRS
jgi:D-alanine-D-alanine ligase